MTKVVEQYLRAAEDCMDLMDPQDTQEEVQTMSLRSIAWSLIAIGHIFNDTTKIGGALGPRR